MQPLWKTIWHYLLLKLEFNNLTQQSQLLIYTIEYIWHMEEACTRMLLEVLFSKGNKTENKKETTQCLSKIN